jgi:hypothetical protein
MGNHAWQYPPFPNVDFTQATSCRLVKGETIRYCGHTYHWLKYHQIVPSFNNLWSDRSRLSHTYKHGQIWPIKVFLGCKLKINVFTGDVALKRRLFEPRCLLLGLD